MYKNKEGYPDPAQGQALNGVRKEERQQLLERQHGIKRGQKIVIEIKERENDRRCKYRVAQKEYIVKALYPYCVLLEDKYGNRTCPSYAKLTEMIRGESEE